MDAGKKSEPVTVQLHVFPSSLVFLIVVEWFLIVIACFSKAKTKQTFTKSKTLPCSKKLFSLLKSFYIKKCKNQVHKGYPLAGPCICN